MRIYRVVQSPQSYNLNQDIFEVQTQLLASILENATLIFLSIFQDRNLPSKISFFKYQNYMDMPPFLYGV